LPGKLLEFARLLINFFTLSGSQCSRTTMPNAFNINLRRRAKVLKFRIEVIAAVIILVMWMAVGVSIYYSRETALADMRANAANLAFAFGDEVKHTLDMVSTSMNAVANRMRAKGANMNIYAWSREIPIMTGPVMEGGIITPSGVLISSTESPSQKPVDMSDRDYFRIQLDGKFKGLFIGAPINSRITHKILIPISERVETKDGRFVGVLVVVLSPTQLTTLYKSINLGESGIISLVGLDKIILARFGKNSPDGMNGIGQSTGNRVPILAATNAPGFYASTSAIDHITRLYSFLRVADYPLVVSVGLGYDEGLASWRMNAKTILVLAAAATLLLGGLTLYLTREIDRRKSRDIELANERAKLQAANTGLQAANTELTASKERAEKAENLLADAVNCITEAFVVYDKDDRFVLCNEAFKRLFPRSIQQMVPGISFEQGLRHSVASGEVKDAIGQEEQWLAQRIHWHQQASDVVQQNLSDGRHVMVVDRRMKSGGIAGLRIDITDLVRTKEALQKALAEAKAVNQAKTQFLANMSHELRTPLNAVIGFSEIISNQTLGPAGVPAYAEYAKDIHDSGEHLLEIINNVLDASRIEIGKLDPEEETVEIGELAQSAINMVRVQAAKKSIMIETRLPEAPNGLRADPLRLRQILINLLANAVKFTPEGGRVTLSFEASSAAAVFAVSDTGIGMSPDEIAVATEPFRQIENTLVKRHEGVGLGLSLAKHMTEMHGGTLEIESEKGVGTTVRVVLPADRILHAPKASAAA
jgi:signal transduction histidine kinase